MSASVIGPSLNLRRRAARSWASIVTRAVMALGAVGSASGSDRAEPAAGKLRIGHVESASIGAIGAATQRPEERAGSHAVPVWSHTFFRDGATFVRIHVEETTSIGAEDTLILRDGRSSVVRAYRGGGRSARWTQTVLGDTATLELILATTGGGWSVSVDQVAWGSPDAFAPSDALRGAFYDICNTMVPSRIRASDPVARITWVDDCGGVYLCSGWLYSPEGYLMTNAHCGNSATEANSLEAWFNYVAAECDLPSRPNPDIYDDEVSFGLMNCDLDYAVFRIRDPIKGNPADVYGYLPIRAELPTVGEELWLPQHPFGFRRQIAESCLVIDDVEPGINGCADPPDTCENNGFEVGASDVSFECALGSGSSGSPVLNLNDEVVALAHASHIFASFGVRMNEVLASLPGAVCLADPVPDCNDDNGCTDDSCSPAAGCVHAFNALFCDDQEPCTTGDVCSAGICAGIWGTHLYADVAPSGGDGNVDVADLLCILDGFANLADCTDGDIHPCGGDGNVDVSDVLNGLAAFSGEFACPHPCPPP